MEKAILKTLIYANIFNYPLKGYEIHKWLIGEETSLIKVEKALKRLIKKRKISFTKDYFFLKNKQKLILIRKRRQKYSQKFLTKAKFFTQAIKIIPWIKLAGVSGGLAVDNSEKKDDIDLFLITDVNRLWLARMFVIILFDFLGIRRKVKMKPLETVGKFCFNTILDEGHLEQKLKDIFTAHEVLQMKVLWQREGIYSKYLSDNEWTFKFLPNWTSKHKYNKHKKNKGYKIFDLLEFLAKWIQLKMMVKPQGLERIEEGGLYFHPKDYRQETISQYFKRIKKFNTKGL